MPQRTALIIGAGIGGLAAAIALDRAGWHVRVLERAANPREPGFALNLAPNATLERVPVNGSGASRAAPEMAIPAIAPHPRTPHL